MIFRLSVAMQRIIVASFHFVILGLLALHLMVMRMSSSATPIPEADDPESAWWGFWPVTYVPDWMVWLAALLLIGGIGVWWLREWYQSEIDILSGQRSPTFQNTLFFVSLLFVVAFYLFPISHTRWGDADILSKAVAWPDPTLRLTHSWQAPLDVWLHSQLWHALHQRAGWTDATPVYRILSPIAGILYLTVALSLSRFSWPSIDWFTYGLLASLGLMQLFFGYVENYSFAAAGVLTYLWLGLRLLRGEGRLWTPALLLGVTIALHPSTAVLLLSLLYLGKFQVSGRFGTSPLSAFVQLVLPLCFVLFLTVILMERGNHGLNALLTNDRPGGGDARWFVPLFQVSTRWEHYTMFSWLHLRDFINEQILVAPAVLPSLLTVGLFALYHRLLRFRSDPNEFDYTTLTPSYTLLLSATQERRFLLIAALSYLGLTFVWNPDYGGQRDWDLFSLAAVPAALLLAWWLSTLLSFYRYFVAAALPLLMFQALHTAAWIYQNTLPWFWPD